MLVRDYLAGLEQMPMGKLDEIAGKGPVLIVAPHQDDESLGCGGLIAGLRERGQAVAVVFITDGSGSHPNSETYPGARLAALRNDEARAALAELDVGPDAITFLDLRDTISPHEGPLLDEAVAALDRIVDRHQISTVFCTSGFDPHGDHGSAAKMARALVERSGGLRLWFYPIWSWHLPPDDWIDATPHGVRLDITPWLARKHAAIACHRSQMTHLIGDDPNGFVFQDWQLAPFLRPVEYFIEAAR